MLDISGHEWDGEHGKEMGMTSSTECFYQDARNSSFECMETIPPLLQSRLSRRAPARTLSRASERKEGARGRARGGNAARGRRRQGRNRKEKEEQRVKVPLLAVEAREAAGSSNTANPTVGGRYCDDSALRKALLVRSAEHTHSRWEPMRMAQSAGGDANGVGEVGTAVTERTNVH